MNASAVFVFFLVAVFSVVFGFPTVEELKLDEPYILVKENMENSTAPELSAEKVEGLRSRRATCDLLSINLPFGSLNHSACAAHCLAKRKGFRGGYCKNGVCHCRR